MTATDPGVLSMPSPLARLYAAAMGAGMNIADHDDVMQDPWPDEAALALVGCDGVVLLAPGITDDGLRADLVAFAQALWCCIVPADEVSDDEAAKGYLGTPDGYAVVLRERVPLQGRGPSHLAWAIATRCGREMSETFAFVTSEREWQSLSG